MNPKIKENIPLKVAMENLAAITAIDLHAPGPLGILRGAKILTSPEEMEGTDAQWLSGEGSDAVLEVLDATYRALQQHLTFLLESPEVDWSNEEQIRAIGAMMALAGESAVRMEKYLALRLGRPVGKISERPEYQDLEHFYQRHIAKKIKFTEPRAGGDDRLDDIQIVRRDQDYELFYLRHEDGTPFFKREIVRHIRLNCDFGPEGDSFEEDPLLRVRAMLDRDLHSSAGQILHECHGLVADLFKGGKKLIGNQLAGCLNQAILALMMAANPRHLIHNTTGKTSLLYFDDFQHFLRAAMRTDEYQKWIAYPPESGDKTARLLLQLTHALCEALFRRRGGVKQESIGLIHRTMRRGIEDSKIPKQRGDTPWTQFLLEDENFRNLLTHFPNGPLLKVLDLIREDQDEERPIPFDPIGQGNLPLELYSLEANQKTVEVLRIPGPTSQLYIGKAEVIDEFKGFLRSYASGRVKRRHLLVNLQERNSWKEEARCRALEGIHKSAEFNEVFSLLGFSRSGMFYHQTGPYRETVAADEFLRALQEHFAGPETVLPHAQRSILLAKAATLATEVHKTCFGSKPILTREERQLMIDMVQHLVVFAAIQEIGPDSISFSCKDAIDDGAAFSASFFALIKMMQSEFATKEDCDYFRWILYTPALFLRERATDPERVLRLFDLLPVMQKYTDTNTNSKK